MTYDTDMAPDAAVFDLDLDGLTVYITDKDGRRDLNAEGEPCRTLADLRALIGELYAEGGLVVFAGESNADQQCLDVRDALLAEIDAATRWTATRWTYAVYTGPGGPISVRYDPSTSIDDICADLASGTHYDDARMDAEDDIERAPGLDIVAALTDAGYVLIYAAQPDEHYDIYAVPVTTEHEYDIRDPLAGDLTVHGETIEDAVATAYADIDPGERPTHVWHGDERIDVSGGQCRPVQ